MHLLPQRLLNQNAVENPNQKKYDIGFLVSCLCCEPKFQHIFEVMAKLDNDELNVLYRELKEGNSNKKLNQFLELEFKNRLGKW